MLQALLHRPYLILLVVTRGKVMLKLKLKLKQAKPKGDSITDLKCKLKLTR